MQERVLREQIRQIPFRAWRLLQELNEWQPVEFICGHYNPRVFALCQEKTCPEPGPPQKPSNPKIS